MLACVCTYVCVHAFVCGPELPPPPPSLRHHEDMSCRMLDLLIDENHIEGVDAGRVKQLITADPQQRKVRGGPP